MGKARRNEKLQKRHTPYQSSKTASPGIKRRQHSQNGKLNSSTRPVSTKIDSSKKSRQQIKIRVPFTKHDRVLLIGEGDFSFALSLARNYEVGAIVATSYDDADTLRKKYPQINETLKTLQGTQKDNSGYDPEEVPTEVAEQEWSGFSPSSGTSIETGPDMSPLRSKHVTLLHGIDATSLSKSHKKGLNFHAPFTKIVFNFPHTGGLSTDVNRQVRANQELLVNFFNAAKPLLATKNHPARPVTPVGALNEHKEADEDEYGSDADFIEDNDEQQTKEQAQILESGRILVTLFEGEPYTLWNIRDLARHCGLQVIESFKFNWAAYPGYKHARTIGDITTGKDRSDEGKRKGAWRGEERDARCYMLGLKEEKLSSSLTKGGKGRSGNDSDESD